MYIRGLHVALYSITSNVLSANDQNIMGSRKSRVPKQKSRKSRVPKQKSRKSRLPKQKSRKSRVPKQKSRKSIINVPKTAKILSKKTKSFERVKASQADMDMGITDLQFMAKSMGIPFGGLDKTKLIRKINNYY